MSASTTGNPSGAKHTQAAPAQLPTVLVGLGVFVVVLAYYLALTAPTITRGGDCGELVAASWTLGLAHPSGYPLYLVAAKAFASLLPWGEIGWRYNAFSAVCSAAAAALTFGLVARVLRAYPARLARCCALGAALLPAATTVVVSQAIIAEVYAANQLMLAALLYCAYAWRQDGDWRWLFSLALVCGLALALHLSAVFVLPGLGILVASGWRKTTASQAASGLHGTRATLVLACMAAGLAVLAYMPLRSGVFPAAPRAFPLNVYFHWPLDWGHPASWPNFKAHATAELYKNLLVSPHTMAWGPLQLPLPAKPGAAWGADFLDWLETVAVQYFWFFPVVLLGAVAAFRERALGSCLLLTVLLNAVQFGYRVNDLPNFFFPTYLVFAVWLGCGLAALGSAMAKLPGRWGWRLKTLGGLLLASTIVLLWGFGIVFGGKRGKTLTRDVALAQAAEVEQLAAEHGTGKVQLLMPSDDFLWAFWYVQYALGHGRNGITPWGRALDHVKEKGLLPRYVGQLQDTGPVLLCQVEEDVARSYPYVPVGQSGVLWQAARRPLPPAAIPMPAAGSGSPAQESARIKPSPLWKTVEGAPALLRGLAVPLEVAIRPELVPAGGRAVDWQAGTLEMLLTAHSAGSEASPSPAQRSQREGDTELVNTVTHISHQSRPLVLPGDYNPQRAYMATVPLQLPEDMPMGRYRIWVRLLPPGAPTETPWQKGQTILLTTY